MRRDCSQAVAEAGAIGVEILLVAVMAQERRQLGQRLRAAEVEALTARHTLAVLVVLFLDTLNPLR